jgi:6-phosphogluconolactonase
MIINTATPELVCHGSAVLARRMNPITRAFGVSSLCLLITAAFGAEKTESPPKEYLVYFGTYTKAKSKGVYRARLDTATGRLSAAELAAECKDPAFLAIDPTERFLYAIDESSDPAKTPGRGVRAYSLDGRTGALTFLNEQAAGGAGPCHLTVDPDGKCVLVANYGGGSLAALPLSSDGRLGAPGTIIQHAGSSVNPTRQKEPHAHGIYVAPGKRFALSPDLGLDKIMVYRLDAAKPSLTPNSPAFASLPPGSGPRHLAFHPSGKFVYVINEMLCTMAAFAYDAQRGDLKPLQAVSTLPAGETVKPGTSTAEVFAHPNGKFLYGSNRGHNSIAVFAIDSASGRLAQIDNTPTQGKAPRHFAIDPTGRWLLAENQSSDTVVVFRIDAESGKLSPTGQSLEVPVPVCAVFVRAR